MNLFGNLPVSSADTTTRVWYVVACVAPVALFLVLSPFIMLNFLMFDVMYAGFFTLLALFFRYWRRYVKAAWSGKMPAPLNLEWPIEYMLEIGKWIFWVGWCGLLLLPAARAILVWPNVDQVGLYVLITLPLTLFLALACFIAYRITRRKLIRVCLISRNSSEK